MRGHRRAIAAVCMLAAWSATPLAARADQWVTPTEFGRGQSGWAHRSARPSGRKLGETFGFKGALIGRHARAQYYRLDELQSQFVLYQERELLNPVKPVFFTLGKDGTLATLDNWHNMGYGPVVVIYAPSGAVLKSYELKDLYTEEQIAKFPMSVSSIWWRCSQDPALEPGNVLAITDRLGQRVAVDLATGVVTFAPADAPCPEP